MLNSLDKRLSLFFKTNEIDWEGYLQKQGTFLPLWKRYFFTLHDCQLTYYSSKEEALYNPDNIKGRILLLNCFLSNSNDFNFTVTDSSKKVFNFLTETEIEKNIWFHLIKKALKGRNKTNKKSFISTVYSFSNLIERNLTFIQQFYVYWSNLMICNLNIKSSINILLTIFQGFSNDIVLSIRNCSSSSSTTTCFTSSSTTCSSTCSSNSNSNLSPFPPSSSSSSSFSISSLSSSFLPFQGDFYGREGILQFLILYHKLVQVKEFNILNTKHHETIQSLVIKGRTIIRNKQSKRDYEYYWKHILFLTPGCKIRHWKMIFKVEKIAFSSSISSSISSSFQHSTRTKKVLSLSLNDFQLLQIIGKGTFGTVIKAKYKQGGELVAIKVIKKHLISSLDQNRIETELAILQDIHHPFITNFKFSFQKGYNIFIGMKLFECGSLYDAINEMKRKKTNFDEETIKFFAAEIVSALSELHRLKIAYRDLKPANIMISDDGHLSLIDFGLSKLNVDINEGAKTLVGSAAYLAPELLVSKGKRNYGISVDWWSLGIILYELSIGNRPFDDSNKNNLYKKILNDKVEIPSQVKLSNNLHSLITELLIKDPNERLGCRTCNSLELIYHPFFYGINWNSLLQKTLLSPFQTNKKKKKWKLKFNDNITISTIINSTKEKSSNLVNTTNMFHRFSFINDTNDSFLINEKKIFNFLMAYEDNKE